MAVTDEVPLAGGRTTGGVVRIGNTVRRPCGPHSPFVHALLRRLEAVGFPHSPRLLGIDSENREILTFQEGDVPADLGWFSDDQLRAAVTIIRLYHQATAGTALAGEEQVVCHGDLSPCNFVFQANLPCGLIDFDAAFAGPRRLDVGYALWLWLDIGNDDADPYQTGRRIAVFLQAYGEMAPATPIAAIEYAQRWLLRRNAAAGHSHAAEVAEWSRRCREWTLRHSKALEAGWRDGMA